MSAQTPAAPASKDEVVDPLLAVLRERGFEGASLADLSFGDPSGGWRIKTCAARARLASKSV
jgi:hypothetical protein